MFPSTQKTMLGGLLRGGALEGARTHVFAVYAWPLEVYVRGSSLGWLGEADDLVRGFFASRLSKAGYLEEWLASGRPLRAWLMVGFKHYLLETARERKRNARAGSLPDEVGVAVSSDARAERAFDASCARAVVAEAFRRASREMMGEGLGAHWSVFERHELGGVGYADVAREHGVTPERARVMARTARERFRGVLRELVGWEGAGVEEVDREICGLMEVLAS